MTHSEAEVQETMVKAIQGRATQKDFEILENTLDPRSLYRFEAYRTSYLGRVLSVLSKTVFAQVESVFGIQVVLDLLRYYFSTIPPADVMITDSLKKLPDFLICYGQSSPYRDLLEGLVRSCLEFWSLAKGIDPKFTPVVSYDPFDLKLGSTSRLIESKGKTDLYSAWVHPEEKWVEPVAFCSGPARGILMVKTGPRTLNSVPVSQSLIPLARELIAGNPLGKITEEILEEDLKNISTPEWADLISLLTQNGCWTTVF